jgi:hypothetical protein
MKEEKYVDEFSGDDKLVCDYLKTSVEPSVEPSELEVNYVNKLNPCKKNKFDKIFVKL